jgi:hypothetical protein
MDQALIERIVANVLQQLQPAPAPRTEVAVKSAAPTKPATEIELLLPVITADVLEDRVHSGQSVRIGQKSLLTPSAHDWLRTRRIVWKRAERFASVGGTTGARWQLLVTTVTPAVRTLQDTARRDAPGWKQELLGTATEAADAATRLVCTADADRVLVISQAAEAVACRANRNAAVRGAVVWSVDHLRSVEAQLAPNVIVLNPTGKSFIELRNLWRACAPLGKPGSTNIVS